MELKKMKPSEVPVGQDIPAANGGNASNGFVMGANLLKDVEKSYDKGKKVLDESEDFLSE